MEARITELEGQIYGVTDYDGNFYKGVKIGTQIWMAEDLRVTHYPNGDPIPNVTDNTDWVNLGDNNTDDAYCFIIMITLPITVHYIPMRAAIGR